MKFCIVFFLVFLFAFPAAAQTSTLSGLTTDESGALVPSSTVTIHGPNGFEKVVHSDARGAYSIAGLPPGQYTIRAEAPQLATPQIVSVTIAGAAKALNLQLSVVAAAEKVTVEEHTGPAVSTDVANNASALVLRGDDLQALSDDPDDLMSDLQALAGPSAGPNGGSIFIDGFSGGELPPKNSIREIRINQNPFSPEFDRLGFGRIEIFTKPGSDHYRGTMDYNFADAFWNSRNPYSAQKAPLRLNELEGNVSGPLGKRASFTVDGQRNTVDNGAIINAIALDPQTLAPVPFFSTFLVPQRLTRINPRADYQLNDNNTLMVRYGITRSNIHGVGIGGFNLESLGYDYRYLNQTVQATETAVLGRSINETRFQYFRSASERNANSTGPELQVLGSFNQGGAPVGQAFDTQNFYELQNYTTMTSGTHVIKFGARLRGQTDDNSSPQNFNGTFTFSGGLSPVLDGNNQPVLDSSGSPQLVDITSIERYRRTLLFQREGLSAAQIRALGGGATQYSVNAGNPELAAHQFDIGVFAGDDWRLKPNFTVSLGFRYETQTNIHDWRDFAPRIAIAWAPSSKNLKPKTVIRAGFGMFYDRFGLANTLTAARYNGLIQQQYVVTNPDFYPLQPAPAGLSTSGQIIQQISNSLRAPYTMQGSVSVERQLPANTTLAVTYATSRALHVFRSDDINAPFPGSGLFPLGHPGPVFLMESSGIYTQNQLIANVNTRVNAGFSLFSFYVLNRARSNSDGFGTFPANPYNYAGEYGPASTDVRHRATVGGSINLKYNVRLSPFLVAQSGAPFDITAGNDLFGTSLFNGRPGIATDPTRPGLIQTAYGLLDPNPIASEKILPRNFGRGPGQINLNLRIGKTFGFGRERGAAANKNSGGGQSSVGANPNLAGGGGLRSIIGAPSTNHRYNLNTSLSVRNLLNHTNPGPIIGNITSPLFGRANQVAGNLNGEGFSENANNRRLEVQFRFTF